MRINQVLREQIKRITPNQGQITDGSHQLVNPAKVRRLRDQFVSAVK